MDDNTPFGRFGLLGKPKPAKSSWWLNLERHDFRQAVDREAERMNQNPQPVNGQNRVVGTHHGKIYLQTIGHIWHRQDAQADQGYGSPDTGRVDQARQRASLQGTAKLPDLSRLTLG